MGRSHSPIRAWRRTGPLAFWACLICLLVSACTSRKSSAPLPELPRVLLDRLPESTRRQLQPAYDLARARPHSANAVGELGILLHTYSEYGSAAQCYRRAELLDPNAFAWPYYLGVVQAAQGQNEDAVNSFRRALNLNPNDINVHLKLADSITSTERLSESSRIYAEILKNHPDCAEAHYGLGRIHAARAEFAAAADSFGKACEQFPAFGAAHYGLGLAYRNLGDPVKSRHHFALYQKYRDRKPIRDDGLLKMVEQANQSPQELLKIGVGLERAGQIQRSAEVQERALELDPRLVLAHINLISIYARLRQLDRAEEHYRAGLLISSGHPELYNNYGVILMMRHRDSEASAMFRKVLEISPRHLKAHMNLALLAEQQGRTAEALARYRTAVEIQPKDGLAQFNLGRLLFKKEDYQGASAHFLDALALDQAGRPEMLSAIAAVYGQYGNPEYSQEFAHAARQQAAALDLTEFEAAIDRVFPTRGSGR